MKLQSKILVVVGVMFFSHLSLAFTDDTYDGASQTKQGALVPKGWENVIPALNEASDFKCSDGDVFVISDRIHAELAGVPAKPSDLVVAVCMSLNGYARALLSHYKYYHAIGNFPEERVNRYVGYALIMIRDEANKKYLPVAFIEKSGDMLLHNFKIYSGVPLYTKLVKENPKKK